MIESNYLKHHVLFFAAMEVDRVHFRVFPPFPSESGHFFFSVSFV